MLLLMLMRVILSSGLYQRIFGEKYSIGNLITSSSKSDIRFETLRDSISENYWRVPHCIIWWNSRLLRRQLPSISKCLYIKDPQKKTRKNWASKTMLTNLMGNSITIPTDPNKRPIMCVGLNQIQFQADLESITLLMPVALLEPTPPHLLGRHKACNLSLGLRPHQNFPADSPILSQIDAWALNRDVAYRGILFGSGETGAVLPLQDRFLDFHAASSFFICVYRGMEKIHNILIRYVEIWLHFFFHS